MQRKKLFEILTLVTQVRSNSWNDVLKIVDVIAKDGAVVKEKMWSDKSKQDNPVYYPLDLSKIETWSTFERCVTLTFFNQQATGKFAFADNLVCDVKIYDGDNFNGERKDLRFTATLSLPDSFIHEIEAKIMYALDVLAEESYDDHLENKKRIWIAYFKSQIIEGVRQMNE